MDLISRRRPDPVVAVPPIPRLIQQARPHIRARIGTRAMQQVRSWLASLKNVTKSTQYRQLGDHLAVEPVYDFPAVNVSLGADDLKPLGLDFLQALVVARDNLIPLSREPFAREPSGLLRSPWQDGYDASRLLLPDHWNIPAARGAWVAMAPHRDVLLVADDQDPGALADMAARTAALSADPQFISGIPLVLRGDAWQTYEPPAGAPAYDTFRQLRWQTLAREYAQQQAALRQLLSQQGKDEFVATLMTPAGPAAEALGTVTVWNRSVINLLPRAEYVQFIDVAADLGKVRLYGVARWEQVVAVCGGLLTPVGVYPERWRTTGAPTEADMKRMGVVPPQNIAGFRPVS